MSALQIWGMAIGLAAIGGGAAALISQPSQSPTPTAEIAASTGSQPSIPIASSIPSVAESSEQLSTKPGAATAQAASYSRHPLLLEDEVRPGTDFFQFREQLRQAIRDRNAAFLRRIADPNIKLSFGLPLTLTDLEIDNPDAPVWQHLERTIGAGCALQVLQNNSASESTQWVCPHAFLAPDRDGTIDAFESIVIVGEAINVRAEPTANSPVVGTVSNEVVKIDSTAYATHPPEFFEAKETNLGWTPVILPNGVRGYVSSRYAFSPVGYRAGFVQNHGQWTMTFFVAGD